MITAKEIIISRFIKKKKNKENESHIADKTKQTQENNASGFKLWIHNPKGKIMD